MARLPQDEDATLISRSADQPTIIARPPQPAQPVPPSPPRRRGTPWLVWFIIVGLFLLVCLVGVAAVVISLRPGTLQTIYARLTAVALTAAPRASAISETATPVPAFVITASQVITLPGTTQLPLSPEVVVEASALPTVATVVTTPASVPATVPASPPVPTVLPTQTATPLSLPSPVQVAMVTQAPSLTPTPVPPSATLTQAPTPTQLPVAAETPLPPLAPAQPATPTVQVVAEGGDIIIAAATPKAPVLGPITFSALTQDGRTLEGDTFRGKIIELHAVFTYSDMVDGTPWERRWYLNDRQMTKGTGVWDKGSDGMFHLTLTASGSPLGSGRWRLEIYADGNLLQQGECVIEAPIQTPAPTPPSTATQLLTPILLPTPAATATVVPTPTTPTVQLYTIVFSRWDGGKHDLYLARTDGSKETFLLQRASGPSWSPDGRYLIFAGQEGVDRQEREGITYHFEGISNGIISMDVSSWSPDLTKVVLRQHVREATARWAAWSPRGDMVAYDARRGGPDWRIYFLGTADNQQYQVEIPGEQADWSPDGNSLVYRSGRENRQGIWISNRDDSSRMQITAEGSDAFPRWSPDGRKIAFHRDSGQNVDIYMMNADGSNVRRLTDAPGPDTLPVWTPDGRIIFRSARSGSWGIYIMNADSSGQRLIIANADPGPDWAFGRMDVR